MRLYLPAELASPPLHTYFAIVAGYYTFLHLGGSVVFFYVTATIAVMHKDVAGCNFPLYHLGWPSVLGVIEIVALPSPLQLLQDVGCFECPAFQKNDVRCDIRQKRGQIKGNKDAYLVCVPTLLQ